MDLLRRPVQDQSLRIMIPGEKQRTNNTGEHGQSSGAESEDEMLLSPSVRRHYKSYTVMQRSGFQHTEYVQILTHLCRTEVFISLLFLVHGLHCPGFPDERAYQGTCHINVLSALVGLFTGGMGIGAVHRFRWRTMLVMWLIMCIISAVANLLAVITTGIWLDHLSKMKARTGIVNGLSGLMLLGSVLVGVCFILTSVLICHYWASNSMKYQPVGRIAVNGPLTAAEWRPSMFCTETKPAPAEKVQPSGQRHRPRRGGTGQALQRGQTSRMLQLPDGLPERRQRPREADGSHQSRKSLAFPIRSGLKGQNGDETNHI